MAATRPRLVAGGGWLADTVADLFLISARHGDDAFVVDTKVWYKYSSSTGMWHQISFGVAPVTDLPVVTADGEVIDQSYKFIDS